MPTRAVKTDLRCGACVESIRPAFDAAGFSRWHADVSTPDKAVTVEGDSAAIARVDELLKGKGYRVLGEVMAPAPLSLGGRGVGGEGDIELQHLSPRPEAGRPSPSRGEGDAVLPSPLEGEGGPRFADRVRGLATNEATPHPAAERGDPLPQGERVKATSYFPLALILVYLVGATLLAEYALGTFDAMRAMRHFMAGFFLVFSFFKLLNLAAFASAYRMYDVVARRWPAYGFVYPFVELALGAAYLANLHPVAVNVATLIVMGVSTVGVLQAVSKKQKIRCACLGTVFNLPMSIVTLVEDGLMLAMAGAMLVA